jgi:hypothetical protein
MVGGGRARQTPVSAAFLSTGVLMSGRWDIIASP